MRPRLGILLLLLLLVAPLVVWASEEGAAAEPGEHTNTTETIFKWVNFVMVFGGGAYLARKPLAAFFDSQRAAIRDAIEVSRQTKANSEAHLAEIEQKLALLGDEVEFLRQEAARNAAAERERIRDATRREAERVLATTKAEIESTARAARLELRAYTARLAVTLAEKRLQQQLTPERHAALFESFVGKLSLGAGAGRN